MPTLDTETRAHHPDSSSSLQSSEACPGFLNEQRESEAARIGTLQHKAAETHDASILETDEQVVAVEKCLEYERKILSRYHNPQVIREQYISVGDEKVGEFRGVTGGFPDLIIYEDQRADIPDWKFGKEPVTPTKNNAQGISYALGAFEKWPFLDSATVHFYAPYQGWTEEEQQEKYVHTFRREEIPELELRLRTIVARKHAVQRAIQQNDWSGCAPKTNLCLWCARKGDCKPLHATILKSSEKHPDFPAPLVVHHMELTRPEQYKLAFRWANQVESIAKAIKKRCTDAVLTEGLELGDDMKLVRRVERQVVSVQGVVETAVRHGLAPEEVTETLSVPITKLEDALKKKAPRGQGAAAVRAFAQELEESGITVPGKPVYFLQEAKSPAEKKQSIIELNG